MKLFNPCYSSPNFMAQQTIAQMLIVIAKLNLRTPRITMILNLSIEDVKQKMHSGKDVRFVARVKIRVRLK